MGRADSPLRVAGVDEAGRGPLAGPVYVAAVVLNAARRIDGLADSKRLSAARRERLYPLITDRAHAWCVVAVDADEIDRRNILQATLHGMARAVAGLTCEFDEAWIDGNIVPPNLPCRGRAIVRGDALKACISAASILAKVARDRHMCAMDARYPGYGFARHKGYPTAAHLEALARLGPCPIHRRSFAPVRAVQPIRSALDSSCLRSCPFDALDG